MKTHFFHLAYLDKETKKEENKNYFDINQNGTSIFNMKFSSKYNFDGISPNSGYFECNKHFISNDSANYNYIVCGYTGSGKSTFVQSLVYALVNKYTPDELNIYALDYSAKMMDAMKTLPHVGGVRFSRLHKILSVGVCYPNA